MPVAARGKTHPRIHAAKLLVRIGRQLYRVCPMQRGSRGKSRGWCWWHELFRGSRRFESVVESRFLFGLFSFFFLPCPSFFVIAFGFFSFSFLFLSLFSFLFSFRSISIRSVRVFLFLAVSDRTRRARIELCKGWGLCGGLNIYPCIFFFFLFFLFPFGSRYAGKRVRTCAIERRALFWSRSDKCVPLPPSTSRFTCSWDFYQWCFRERKFLSFPPSFFFHGY